MILWFQALGLLPGAPVNPGEDNIIRVPAVTPRSRITRVR